MGNMEEYIKVRKSDIKNLEGMSYSDINRIYIKCEFCNEMILKHSIDKHRQICPKNPLGLKPSKNYGYKLLEKLRKEFPEVYSLLTATQIRRVLDTEYNEMSFL